MALILTLAFGSGAGAGERAEVPDADAAVELIREQGMTVNQALDHLGLEAPKQCQALGEVEHLNQRHAQWQQAIDVLARTHTDEVVGWIIGSVRPPKVALKEAEFQKNCLLEAMIGDVRNPEYRLRLVLNYSETFEGSVANVRQLADQFKAQPRWRRRVYHHLTRSGYRDAAAQAHIWQRKYLFQGRSFNIISELAGELCGLTAGQTWKPGFTRHERCWRETLSAEQREREILHASAAPGVSRHHWGTEFDLFSLNPHSFRPPGLLAGDYEWLDRHALDHGFFQPYKGSSNADELAYIEERWHWSYYPIGHALLGFAAKHDELLEAALHEQWDEMEARANRWRRNKVELFPFIRTTWRAFMFNIDTPNLDETP